MPIFKLNVKWGKEKYPDIEVDSELPPIVFKGQLMALTEVPVDRQKILLKGVTLGDEEWGRVKLTNGANFLLMGSPEPLQTPEHVETSQPKFTEDMTSGEISKVLEVPPGLNNLGNTCYLNATLQCLRTVPELRTALQSSVAPSNYGDVSRYMTWCMRNVFKDMETTTEGSYSPTQFLAVLYQAMPQFAATNPEGQRIQQDASECWTQLVQRLQGKLSYPSDDRDLIDSCFGIGFEKTLKCVENEEEPPQITHSRELKLSCHIDKTVKYLHTGIKTRLDGEEVTKMSPSLNKNALYQGSSRLSRLPAYLTVEFVRFFFKEKDSVNAKILKEVDFPMVLDVGLLCTEELKRKLGPMKEKFKLWDNEVARLTKIVKMSKNDSEVAEASKLLEAATGSEQKEVEYEPFSFPDDPGSNYSGVYELQAVLTHKGRSSNSGHYVAWVKHPKFGHWFMFDDDDVTAVSEEDVKKLAGGGDWHTAYILLYGPRRFPVSGHSVIKSIGDGKGEVSSSQVKEDEKMEVDAVPKEIKIKGGANGEDGGK